MEAEQQQRLGQSCKFLRSELAELQVGQSKVRTFVRLDGLKHRNIVNALVLLREEQSFAGLLIVNFFDVYCECSLKLRLSLRLCVNDTTVRDLPWLDDVEISDSSNVVRFGNLLTIGDFEGADGDRGDALLTAQVLLDLRAATPQFLLPPPVATQQWTSLCDEDAELATVVCSDGSIASQRALLRLESPTWRSKIGEGADAGRLDCSEFSVAEMRTFLFFLSSRDYYDIARFDTLHLLVRIAARFSVSCVTRRCALFVNECLHLHASSAAAAADDSAAVRSKVRWGVSDLVDVWNTTVSHLDEEGLAKAVMRLICKTSYAEIAKQPAFKQLDSNTKGVFYHYFLLCKEETEDNSTADAEPSTEAA